MRKTLPSLFALSLALGGLSLAGCTTKKVTEVNGAAPAISSVSPTTSYRGRTIDVTLAGSGTAWDANTKVDFGTGITVNKVTVASTAALIANITIAADSTVGAHDVTVTDGTNSEPYKMVFNVQAPIAGTFKGTVAQGSVVFFTIKNSDLSTPFDATQGQDSNGNTTYPNVALSGTTGVSFQVSSVTATEIGGAALIDTTAAAGPLDIDVKSGPTDGTGTVIESTQAAAGTIAARTATALSGATTASLTDPVASMLYTVTPAKTGDSIRIIADDTNAASNVLVFSGTVDFDHLLAVGATASFTATSTTPVFVIVYDSAAKGGVDVSIKEYDFDYVVQAGGEGNDTVNGMSTGAVSITAPPAKLSGMSLSSADDADWYKVTVPVGKVIHVQTVAGDDTTPTVVTFYGTDGATQIGTTDDQGTQSDVTSPMLAGAGTYFFKITYGTGADTFFGGAPAWAAGNSHYDLLVDLE
ncbi:MAG: hypothetical protein ABI321_23190 [Polyangia bacterium]